MAKKKPTPPTDLRRAILDASLALVEEGGVGALSMREVARRANVTHGAPYHHFPDRAAILAALAQEGFALLAEEMARAIEKEPRGSIASLEASGCAYFRFAQRHAAYMRIMFRPELACPDEHPEVDGAAEAAVNVVFDCVVACQAAGNAPPGDPMPIVLTAWATAHGLASLWLDGPLPRLHKWSASPSLPVTVARTLGGLLAAAGRSRRKGSG